MRQGYQQNNVMHQSPDRATKKTIYRLSEEYAQSGEKEERMSPVKNRFLKEEWCPPGKGFMEKLVQSKAHIDHTMTAELSKYQSRIWDLETQVESLKQAIDRLSAEGGRQCQNLKSRVQTYKELLQRSEQEKTDMLNKRNEAVRVEINKILAGHQEAIIYYEMMKADFERLLGERDARIEELSARLQDSQGNGNQLEQEKKELQQQLAHNNQIKEQLRQSIKKNEQTFDKQLKQTKDHFEQKVQGLNNDKTRMSIEHAKQLQNVRNINRLDKQNLIQGYEARLDSVQSSHAARVHELQSALIKLEEDLKHALITISELEKEQTLLKGDLAQSNNQLQRRTQDTILLDKEYTNLLKEYDLISRDKSFLQADNQRSRTESMQHLRTREILQEEVEKLKEVLVESSLEMERCRDELIKGERDKQVLRLQRDDAQIRLQKIERLLADREKEAQRWRQNYYTLRNKI